MHTHRALVCVVQGNLPASRECMPVVHSVSTGVFWGTGPLGRKKGTPLQSWLLPTSWASEEPVFPFSVDCRAASTYRRADHLLAGTYSLLRFRGSRAGGLLNHCMDVPGGSSPYTAAQPPQDSLCRNDSQSSYQQLVQE